MKHVFCAISIAMFAAGVAQAECFEADVFAGLGQVKTKGGGTYYYGETVGGPAILRGHLAGRPDGLPEATFDPEQGYDLGFADKGLAHRLLPDAVAAEPEGAVLTVEFWAKGDLPKAAGGKSWQGKIEANIFSMPPAEHNRHLIGSAKLEGSYDFLAEMQADISDCSYRIIPVEMRLTERSETVLQRRILYFPDLGVSAITKWGPDADGPLRKTGVVGFASGN